MWQLLFRFLIARLLGLLWLTVLVPALFIILTPVIFLRALFVAWRHNLRFRVALADGYADIWQGFRQVVGFLFTNRK